MNTGSYPESYLASLLEQADGRSTSEDDLVIKWTAGSLYTGGADTVRAISIESSTDYSNIKQTVSALSCFYLAMALYPEVQKKAREELDRVLGPNKLPTFDDRDKLLYIEAIVKETLRWHPVAPMGIPHLCTEDDIYNGYLIPKGALILPNIW